MFGGRFSSSIGNVGIAIESAAIKLIQVREQNRLLEPVGAACIRLNGGIDCVDTRILASQLDAAIGEGGFAGRRCVVSLPRKDVHIQSIRLPTMPEHELRQAVLWEAMQRFGLEKENAQVDFIRTGACLHNQEGREEVLIIAADHKTISRRMEPIFEAGLRPTAIDLDFTAIARVLSRQFRRESDRDIVRAVLDVGQNDSMFMVLRGDQIAFAKVITVGGGHMDKAVAEHLDLDIASARQLRVAHTKNFRHDNGDSVALPLPDDPTLHDVDGEPLGSVLDSQTEQAVFDAVRPLISEIVREVNLCLRYYGVTFRGTSPDQLILTGSERAEPRLDETIEENCKVKTVFDDHVGTLHHLETELTGILARPADYGDCWAAAVGLSIRDLDVRRQREADTKDETESPVDERVNQAA